MTCSLLIVFSLICKGSSTQVLYVFLFLSNTVFMTCVKQSWSTWPVQVFLSAFAFLFFYLLLGFLKKIWTHIIFGSFCSRIQYNILAFLVTNQIIYTHTLYLVSPGFRASYQLKSIWSFPLTSNIKKAYSSRGLLLTGFYWGNPSGSAVSDIFHQQRCHVQSHLIYLSS